MGKGQVRAFANPGWTTEPPFAKVPSIS
jgi:hypothetical protein